jgi:hypothetical protein
VVEETAVDDPFVEEVAVSAALAVDDLEANTVWPANSVTPRVASRDPPANQKVAARALRIPRRRRAPIGRSEGGGMTNR